MLNGCDELCKSFVELDQQKAVKGNAVIKQV